jgi:hypothetical protein
MPPRGLTFADVRKIALSLEGVEDSTAYGSPSLKVNGKMLACIAINKAAEPNSLMVRMPFEQRDALVEEEPGIYYLKPHYEPYACVLVRLSKVHRDALRDLLTGAWRFVSAEKPRRRTPAPARRASSTRTRA